MKIFQKVFPILLALTLCLSAPGLAVNLVSDDGEGSIDITTVVSKTKGGEAIDWVENGGTFFVQVRFSGNPTSLEESVQVYQLFFGYDPAKAEYQGVASGLTSPTASGVNGILTIAWAGIEGLVDQDTGEIQSSGRLASFRMTAKTDLTADDLTLFSLRRDNGAGQDSFLASGSSTFFGLELPQQPQPPSDDNSGSSGGDVSQVPETFPDVSSEAWYHGAVQWAVASGITSGTGNGSFSPDRECTRAEAMTFLWRAAGSPEPGEAGGFQDVEPGSYYEKAVRWAVEQGITNGTGQGVFSPNALVDRSQVVTFLQRFARGEAADGGKSFSDVPEEAFYAQAVRWAVEQGITNGTGETTFSPLKSCTRAEIVTFLYRQFTK